MRKKLIAPKAVLRTKSSMETLPRVQAALSSRRRSKPGARMRSYEDFVFNMTAELSCSAFKTILFVASIQIFHLKDDRVNEFYDSAIAIDR